MSLPAAFFGVFLAAFAAASFFAAFGADVAAAVFFAAVFFTAFLGFFSATTAWETTMGGTTAVTASWTAVRAPFGVSRDRNPALGRNTGATEAASWIAAPVCGLRPDLAARSRRSKVPKPIRDTRSPRATLWEISSSTPFTAAVAV